MNARGSVEQTAYKAGYRHYQWHDANRQRPVWVDVWYLAKDEAEELPLLYGLGQGSAAHNAEVAAPGVPFPLVVLSHGAFGAARDYR